MPVFDPYSPALDADPFPIYRELRDAHPCFWSTHANMWVLTRHEDVAHALKDWQTYSSASGNLMDELPNRAGATLGTTDPPRHDRLRALVQHAFVRRNLSFLEGDIRAAAQDAIARIAGRGQFDFIADFSSLVTVKALFRLLGLPPGEDAVVREKAVLMVQSDPVTRGKGPEHIAAYQWMQAYAEKVIAERRANPTGDLISQFSLAEIDGDRLDEREVLLTTTTLIMAGIESLGGFLAMFALNLADHPEARRRCAADPALIPHAIDESLRFNTSAQRFKRRLTRDTQLHAQTMRQGDFVCLAFGAANRDERKFLDPDRYDIDRRPMGHLGFGGGVHACLGAPIAKLAAQLCMEEFLAAIPDFARAESTLPWLPSSTFRSPMRLLLTR
ncbi:MAG: cytochrome P450 [Hyphomonadaceae bacterium]|nr:cytochrome P450 [Hyphomonadaceae bacterium]